MHLPDDPPARPPWYQRAHCALLHVAGGTAFLRVDTLLQRILPLSCTVRLTLLLPGSVWEDCFNPVWVAAPNTSTVYKGKYDAPPVNPRACLPAIRPCLAAGRPGGC